jgi:hypothetical protein
VRIATAPAWDGRAPITGPCCEIGTTVPIWGADDVAGRGGSDRNQQRSGERVAGRHDTGSNVAEVISRMGRTADSELHSSLIFGFVSWRTVLSRFLHGVNRERVAPWDNPDEWGQTIESPVWPVLSGWIRSPENSVDVVPRAGAASKMQANSINVADRLQIIPMPFNPHDSWINNTTSESIV